MSVVPVPLSFTVRATVRARSPRHLSFFQIRSLNTRGAMAISESCERTSAGSHGKCLKVAVVGAGAAGLVTARSLLKEGHSVRVFEQSSEVGGTWNYKEDIDSDPVSQDSSRTRVHSSMYASLRTNLPRECMSFLEFPLVPGLTPGSEDSRRYCSHEAVALYLQHFARVFEIVPHIRFRTRVDFVEPLGIKGVDDSRHLINAISERKGETESKEDWLKWRVGSSSASVLRKKNEIGSNSHADTAEVEEKTEEDIYDAVVVCNGHYSEPKIATIPGLEEWPGRQIHSHNYRRPELFSGLTVVVVGAGSSGEDLAREVAMVSREVHMCARSFLETENGSPSCPEGPQGNLWRHPMAVRAFPDGRIEFADGFSVIADIILHCTGYTYSFPFLRNLEDFLEISDARIHSLYEHVFPPSLAPSLSFVGIPWKVAPFPLMELQSTWIAKVLSGKVKLPSKEAMDTDIQAFYDRLEEAKIPKRYTHAMGKTAIVQQFEYLDGLASRCGLPPVENWRKEMYSLGGINKQTNPQSYRDTWQDCDVTLEAAIAQEAQLKALEKRINAIHPSRN